MTETIYKVHDDLSSHADESYMVLKTNLQYYSLSKEIKKLVITSTGYNEGKTTTAINLGISYAKSGLKVVLIDADLHKPMLVKRLGNNNLTGLTNYISSHASLEEIINITTLENFYFISCGPKPPKPSEVLSSNRFTELMELLETQFDMIIIDTPPLGKYIDAAILAPKADGTLLVIKANYFDSKRINNAKSKLDKVNANILGVVLNNLDKRYYKFYSNHYDDHGLAKKFKEGWFKKYKERN
ncbi:MAG: CpsD/CapB family tyrosine-protein kinase [Bacillota bacterium]